MSQNTSIPDGIGRGGLTKRDLEALAGKPRGGFPAWVAPAILAVIFLAAAVVMSISLFTMQDNLTRMDDEIADINASFEATTIQLKLTLAAMEPTPTPDVAATPEVVASTPEGEGETAETVWAVKITPPENLLAGGTAVITIEVSQDNQPAAGSDVSLDFSGPSAPKLEEVVPQGPYKTDANGKLEISFPLLSAGDFIFTAKAGDIEESAPITVAAVTDTDGDGVSDEIEQSTLYATDPNSSNIYIVTADNNIVNFRLPEQDYGTVAAGISSGSSVFGFERLQPAVEQAYREVEFTALYMPGKDYAADQPLTLKIGETLYDPAKEDNGILKIAGAERTCGKVENSVKPFCEVIGTQGEYLLLKIRGYIGKKLLEPASEQVTPSPTPTEPVITPTETPEATTIPTP